MLWNHSHYPELVLRLFLFYWIIFFLFLIISFPQYRFIVFSSLFARLSPSVYFHPVTVLFLWHDDAITHNVCTVAAVCPTDPACLAQGTHSSGWGILTAKGLQLSSSSGNCPERKEATLPWGQPASKNAQISCLSLEQLWRIIPVPDLHVGSAEACLQSHCSSPSPSGFLLLFYSSPVLFSRAPSHETSVWKYKTLRVYFPGTWPLTLPNKIRRSRGIKNVFIQICYHLCALSSIYKMVSQKLTRCQYTLYVLLLKMYRKIKCIDWVEP